MNKKSEHKKMGRPPSEFPEFLKKLRATEAERLEFLSKFPGDAREDFLQIMGEKERGDRLEAMIDRMSETIVELRAEVTESNGLLRSANSIAERDGRETNWEAFRMQLSKALVREFELMKKHDIRPV